MGFTRFGAALIAAVAVNVVGIVSAADATVTVQPGDSFWSIARAQHVSWSALEAANSTVTPNNMLPGTVLQVPSASTGTGTTYSVQPGDTFWLVARKWNIAVGDLAAANPSVQPLNLQIGTTLTLPAPQTTVQTAASTVPVSGGAATGSTATSSVTAGNASPEDLYWLEHLIHAEATGQPLRAQIAVGDVVMHRIQSGNYASTVKGVVFQVLNGHYQFSCIPNGFIYTTPDAQSVQAAKAVLQQNVDVVPGALVFYNPAQTASNSWVWSQPTVGRFGALVFAQ